METEEIQTHGQPSLKRARLNNGGRRETAGGSSSAGNYSSFAARMMAKMGHVQGQGLGSSGQGRAEPIQSLQRAQGVGLGAAPQDKEAKRRDAASRGEKFEDSEEERKKERKKRTGGVQSGSSTPKAKPKVRYKTAADFEAAAEGLQLPNVLKTLVDLTGKETALGPSTGFSTPNGNVVPQETEAAKVTNRVRRELEAFLEEWKSLEGYKTYYEHESSQLIGEIDKQQEEVQDLEHVIQMVREIQIPSSKAWVPLESWEATTSKLEDLQAGYSQSIDDLSLQEVAVAAITPSFRRSMLDWKPLEEPSPIISFLERLRPILGLPSPPTSEASALTLQSAPLLHPPRPSTSRTIPYETLIYTLFVPPVRTAITSSWSPYDPSPLLMLLQAWLPLLPPFIPSVLLQQTIIPLLTTAIQSWKPSSRAGRSSPPPHLWLFPWLPHLPPAQTSSTSSTGLLQTLKSRFRSILRTCPLKAGPPTWLMPWQSLLAPSLHTLLSSTILPRLASHLHQNFDINPEDQDLAPLLTVFSWTNPLFSSQATSELLIAEFFPKWHLTLYEGLKMSYERLGEWVEWWKEQIPEAVNEQPQIIEQWIKAAEIIEIALNLEADGLDIAEHLPQPVAGPPRPFGTSTIASNFVSQEPSVAAKPPPMQESTFKEVVEDFCAENDLFMIALREAHAENGLPLYRITARADERGGAVVYLKGDVIWARGKAGDRKWEAVGLEAGLVGIAGG